MTKQVWIFLLSLVLLLAVLAALMYATPKEQGLDTLSVLVLCPGEGNAVLVTCGGETLLLPVGDDEDRKTLNTSLKKQQLLSIVHESVSKQDTVSLGDAVCEIEQTDPNIWLLTVTHAENRLRLRLSQTALPELWLNDEPSVELETDRHSVRILSDGTRFTIRPDFSMWDD